MIFGRRRRLESSPTGGFNTTVIGGAMPSDLDLSTGHRVRCVSIKLGRVVLCPSCDQMLVADWTWDAWHDPVPAVPVFRKRGRGPFRWEQRRPAHPQSPGPIEMFSPEAVEALKDIGRFEIRPWPGCLCDPREEAS